MKKIIFLIMCLFISISSVWAIGFPIKSFTPIEVGERITGIQGAIPSSIPSAPTGYDRKGYVGTILANIFDASQDIKGEFIQAFKDVWGVSNKDNIPKWNGQVFKPGTIWDKGGNVGIGTSSPARKLHIRDTIADTVTIALQDNDASWFLSTTTQEGFGIFDNTTGSSGARLLINAAGNVGIGTTIPSGTLKLEVSGNIGATQYCDENGNNCFTAASVGTGTGTSSSNILLGTSKTTKIIAPSGTQCIPSVVKNSVGLLCEYDRYKGELQVTNAGVEGRCGYTCDLSDVAVYTEYTVFKKAKYWGGAKWFGANSNQRVVTATATCNPGDIGIQKRTVFHSNGMSTGNTYTPFINEYNARNSAQLDTAGVVWVKITNGDNFAYRRSYNGYNRLGSRGSYAVAEVKCVNIK